MGDRHGVDPHPRRARGMQRRFGIPGDPLEDLLIGLDVGPWRHLTAVELIEGGLGKNVPGNPYRLDPFLAIVLGRQVVELHRRVVAGVGRRDANPASHVAVHRSDVDLIAVTPLGRGPVIANRDR